MSSLDPGYRHRFVLADGSVLTCAPKDARRTIDKRHPQAQPETVWEVTLPSGIVRRLWPDEIRDWTQEDVLA